MRILPLPAGFDVTRAWRDPASAHPLLPPRLADLESRMVARKMPYLLLEFFRYDARQGWLYGGGRSSAQLTIKGISEAYARPDAPIVTDAWSAATSAHGWTRQNDAGIWVPAAAAVDLIPVGRDGKPFTADDPLAEFIALVAECSAAVGLRHFRRASGQIWDKDHVEMVEYSNATHQLELPNPRPSVTALPGSIS